jgi:hypothetical protein
LFAMLAGAYAVYNHKSTPVEVASTTKKAPVTTSADSSVDPQAPTPTLQSREGATNAPPGNENAELRRVVGANKKGNGNANNTAPPATTEPYNALAFASEEKNEAKPLAIPSEGLPVEQNLSIGLTEVPEPQDKSVAKNEVQQKAPDLLSAEEINAIAEARDKEEKAGVSLSPWLGVGAAAGSFSPNTVVNGGMFATANADYNSYYASQGIPQSYNESVGSAYSTGVSGGVRVAKRWVIQSGVNYINQRVDYTTSFVGISASNQPSAMTKEYIANTSLDVMVTNPYHVSSATEILSIPVQAGFLIIDKRIGWQLSSGVSTDFLLRNTLTDKSGVRSRVTEGAGEDSPYRAVNWAAMLNTELSYKIGDHYRIAIVPGFRYSFKPMLKADSNGTPLILDVGFRFKYLFN